MALINLRNALMAGKRLPYDAEVEYLESTGTQWIDTGVPMSSQITVAARLERVSGVSGYYFGAYDNRVSPTVRLSVSITRNNTFYFLFADNTSAGTTPLLPSGFHDVTISRTGWQCDGEVTSWSRTDFARDSNIFIFGRSINGNIADYSRIRVASLQILSGGVLVRDFIPVRRGTVGYLYDRVSGKLFGNQGTGDFVLGPDVVPVEWLEFTGTQRLLTDITPNVYDRSLKTSISYQLTSTVGRQMSGSGSSYFEFCSQGSFVQADASYPADLNRHTIEFIGWNTDIVNSPRVLYDGQRILTNGFVRSADTSNHFTFGSIKSVSQSNPLKAKVYSLSMEYQDATKFLHWLPVRVGTDATSWEGAMMDVLTRRIYRNAGAGAFTYGNDLRYPIPSE